MRLHMAFKEPVGDFEAHGRRERGYRALTAVLTPHGDFYFKASCGTIAAWNIFREMPTCRNNYVARLLKPSTKVLWPHPSSEHVLLL